MATTMLVCKQCNFENEPERVYCHNCGAKLDRSLLPPEASKREDPVLVQERVRKIIKPRNATLKVQLKHLVSCVLLSALLAVLVLILKPPASVPQLTPEAVMDAPSIVDDMDNVLQVPAPQRLSYTEAQLNAYLAQSLKSGKVDKAGSVPIVSFQRAFAHLEDGGVSLTMVDSLFGLPLYATTHRTVSVRNGVLVSRPVDGSLGRLPIPARLLPYFEGVFKPLEKAADRPLKMLAQMNAVNVRKGAVDLVSPGRR